MNTLDNVWLYLLSDMNSSCTELLYTYYQWNIGTHSHISLISHCYPTVLRLSFVTHPHKPFWIMMHLNWQEECILFETLNVFPNYFHEYLQVANPNELVYLQSCWWPDELRINESDFAVNHVFISQVLFFWVLRHLPTPWRPCSVPVFVLRMAQWKLKQYKIISRRIAQENLKLMT